jgi:parvulin-like peptidyl-prolyl isomerase
MIRSSLKKILLLLLAAGLLLSSCGLPSGDPGQPENSEKIVLARINGTPVLLSEFFPYIQSFLDDEPEDLGGISTRELFDEYLTQVLLLKEADKTGIVIPQEELEQYLVEWSISQEETSSMEMEPMVRDYLKVQKLLKQEVNVRMDITLQELINYYDENIEGFTVGDQAHVLEILTDERDQAEELKARINNGDSRKFRQMARDFSRGATAESEGDLGFFQKGDLPEEFDKVIFSLKPGEISEPFQSSHGYHLFYLEEWIPSHQYKFHEVKNEIFRRIAAKKERQRTEEYINSLMNQYSITIYESNFPVDSKEYSFDQNDS